MTTGNCDIVTTCFRLLRQYLAEDEKCTCPFLVQGVLNIAARAAALALPPVASPFVQAALSTTAAQVRVRIVRSSWHVHRREARLSSVDIAHLMHFEIEIQVLKQCLAQ